VVPVVIEDARPQSLGGRLDVPVVQHRSEEPVRV
jgi:hypothetical protein